MPRTTHGLVDEAVGGIVPDEELRLGIEVQRAVQPQGAGAEVDQRAAAMADALVEREAAPRAHALQEVGVLRFGIGHLGDLLHDVRDRALETAVDLAARALDVGHLAERLVALALEDDLAAVLIRVDDLAPDAHGVVMLLGGVDLDLHGRGVVLAQQVLHGVHVVLAHVGQAAAVVVPVAAEGLVHAVSVVGLPGGRTEPHVVVELRGYGLGLEVVAADPEELPREARGAGDRHLERPAQQPAVDEFLQRLDGRAQTVEGVLEAEPRVEPEDAVVAPHGLDDALALADGARHGLLAPDVLAGARRLDGHDAVPVRRRGDVDDVDVRVGDQVAEVGVGLQGLTKLLLAQLDAALEVTAVDVAHRHQPALLGAGEVVAALADAAHADDALGELVARGDEVRAAEHVARDDGQQRHAAQRFQEVSAGCHISSRFTVFSIGCCARGP